MGRTGEEVNGLYEDKRLKKERNRLEGRGSRFALNGNV